MNIGKLDKRIELQHYVNKTWTTYATVWAEFRNPDLKTAEIAGNLASELTREINIRRRTDVIKGHRVLWGSRKFDVLHAYDRVEDKGKMAIVCREVVM